ncbi:MAG: 30S ribosomal protein S1 [Rickettsiaceae bacterium]|nr:30S ribosomal protein S1 [Rickettsiaceae bacterium]
MNKKRFIPQLHEIENKNEAGNAQENFTSLLNEFDVSHIKEGTVVKGQVVSTKENFITVDVGLKNEGIIPISEFKIDRDKEIPQPGDWVEVYVERTASRRGTVLSREKAIREESWLKLEEIFAKGENINGIIRGPVKGGLIVDLNGVAAFLPGSQVDVRPVKDIKTLIDIEQPFQILKMDKKLGNIVVSRKAILEESRSEAKAEKLLQIKEGMVLDGIVKNITDYGVFVDLGDSVDGLLHVTDISWRRINHPSEVLSMDQKIKVQVIKFNEEIGRISLGMKQLDENPWQNIKDEFPLNEEMTGKISNIADYGVFIELKDGIEGLVHSSEISWGKSNQRQKNLTIGKQVKFKILNIDTEKNRISLTIKGCEQNPLIEFAEANSVGSVIKAPIRNITDFGIFVKISENTDGMIHESDISWEGNGAEALKNYNKGDEIECKVLKIDVEEEKVALGIKQLTDNPYGFNADEFKKHNVVTCTVTGIKSDGIEVNVEDKAPGFIKKSDLSSERSDQKPERFAEGDQLDAKIISIDKTKINLSIKALEIEERAKAIKEYGSTDSGARLGDILGAALGEGDGEKKKDKEDKKNK